MPRICLDVSLPDVADVVLLRNILMEVVRGKGGTFNAVKMDLPYNSNTEWTEVENPFVLGEAVYLRQYNDPQTVRHNANVRSSRAYQEALEQSASN